MSTSVRESIGWAVRAASLATAFPVSRLDRRVLAEIDRSAPADRWCVALSGGADSLCLLLLLWAHWPERRGALRALHFNHRLRGDASECDAAFCREVCSGLGVAVIEREAEWGGSPEGVSGVSENDAREARFSFFKAAMKESSSSRLFLGHQLDDVAETMLMRLARGSGTAGLAAPRPVSRHGDAVYLRPLLGMAHAAIVGALREAGAPWREDASNSTDRYFRTRVRTTVVPALNEASPSDFPSGAAASRELLEEDDEALEAWADRIVPDRGITALPIEKLKDCPRAIARRVLHRWLLARLGTGRLTRVSFDSLLDATCRGDSFRRSAGGNAVIRCDGLFLFVEELPGECASWDGFDLSVPGQATLPDGGVIVAEVIDLDPGTRQSVLSGQGSGPFVVYLGFEGAPPAWFAVRPWKPGDRYASLGSTHESKLQDHFTNRRIPKGMRHTLPLLVAPSDRILWVPGLPPAESVRVLPNATFAVRLTYRPPEPLFDPSNV